MNFPKVAVIVITVFLIAGLGLGFLLWTRPQGESRNSAVTVTTNTAERIVDVSVTPGKLTLVTASGLRVPFVDLSDVYADHVHPAEFHDGNIYVIRRIGDSSSSTNWTDELWRISSDKTMEKLYSQKGFDFRVSADEQWVAVTYNSGERQKLTIFNPRSKAERSYTIDELAGTAGKIFDYQFDGWTPANVLWGHSFHADQPVFAAVNPSTAAVQSEPFPPHMPIQPRELAFNLRTETVAYSTYPFFYDAESTAAFERAGTEVTLYMYDFATKNVTTVATSQGREFKPAWLSGNRLEYTNPADGQRTAVTVGR